ncbi:DNA-binding response regulator [Ktedonobacteria bacterium brp13]|nr:DNA-binding response regulator [Ktedonobacteria bacterium brp13]
MPHKILVVDDDTKTVDLIRLALEQEEFEALIAYEGIEALNLARYASPDLMILDWMLPNISGIDLCRMVRAESNVPMIMLTAKATEEDKLRGLNLGVDDYLTKPFSLRELVARVRVVLRRTHHAEERPTLLRFRELEINVEGHEVRLGDQAISLTPKEFKLLETFVRAPGRTFRREELVEKICGPDYDGFDRSIDFHMGNLRKKIDIHPEQPSYIQTVHGVGYKLRRTNHVA